MNISQKMQDSINNQINEEFYSAYLYLSMAAYLESINLRGMANWMRVQYQEEITHAFKFYNYVLERGGKINLKEIKQPQIEWECPLCAFQDALEHEKKITASINNLVNLANEEKDHATANMLQWFVDEQVEEEASVTDIIGDLEMADNSKGALYMINRELGNRSFVDETKESK